MAYKYTEEDFERDKKRWKKRGYGPNEMHIPPKPQPPKPQPPKRKKK